MVTNWQAWNQPKGEGITTIMISLWNDGTSLDNSRYPQTSPDLVHFEKYFIPKCITCVYLSYWLPTQSLFQHTSILGCSVNIVFKYCLFVFTTLTLRPKILEGFGWNFAVRAAPQPHPSAFLHFILPLFICITSTFYFIFSLNIHFFLSRQSGVGTLSS